MKSRLISAVAACAAIVLLPSIALADPKPTVSPEQRLDRLEKQVQQMQRQVFPKGRPADTAGFLDDPAATQSSVVSLDQRLDALEKQMADLIRASEENGNRLRTLETGLGQLRSSEDQRIAALEQRAAEAQTAPPLVAPDLVPSGPAAGRIKPQSATRTSTRTATQAPIGASNVEPIAATDAGEDAYSEGFRQWEAGQYDQAINSLRAFVAAYPKHHRVSYANNLIGRALLDKGDARGAASMLLANYRTNPAGDRAPDSLYYLGQALMKLGQPGQACKAYAELDAVYGAKVRPDLKKLEVDGKAEAQCH